MTRPIRSATQTGLVRVNESAHDEIVVFADTGDDGVEALTVEHRALAADVAFAHDDQLVDLGPARTTTPIPAAGIRPGRRRGPCPWR